MANPNWIQCWLRSLLIIAAGFWVFSPAMHGDWLMDDDFYLPMNALVNDPHRLWKIWFAPGSLLEYYPVEASLQAGQWHLWHLNTTGYHLCNVALHVIGALLVWRLLARFGLRHAWLGGFLFAVHPANVESVAWIAEFKNVLSLPPFLLCMCAWIDFEEHGKRGDYFKALSWFLLAMLCKISMAPFAFVILLYAWWKRGRVTLRDGVHALPFLVIAVALAATTILAGNWFRESHLQSASPPYIGDWVTHLALAGQTIAFYLSTAIFPVEMIPIYPQWPIEVSSPLSYLPWLLLAAVLIWFWAKRKSWGRHALLGAGFFLLTLFPFVGLTSVSYMEFTWVMDHFLYIPMIGLIGLIIAAYDQIEGRFSASGKRIYTIATAVVLALLALESHLYSEVFIGPEKLWTYTIARNPDCYLPYNNLGAVMLETGRTSEAIANYEKALALHPTMVEAYANLGLAYSLQGDYPKAIAEYEKALKLHPHHAVTHANLGNALQHEGRDAEAITHYEEALRTDPRNADALTNLAKLKSKSPGRGE